MKKRILAILAAAVISLAPLSSLAAYQSTTLRNGMRGEEVAEIQRALITLGYLREGAARSDQFDWDTQNAVKAAQKAFEMEQTGIADTAFFKRLFSE